MDQEQRLNTITWLTSTIRDSYTRLLEAHFPLMIGLPPDDQGDGIVVSFDDMTDQELEELLRCDQQQFEKWLVDEIREYINGCFHAEAQQVLFDHVYDMMVDHPELKEDEIRRAVTYLAERSLTTDLIGRFEDEVDRWLKLIALAKADSSDDEE